MKQYISTEQTLRSIEEGVRLMLVKIDIEALERYDVTVEEYLSIYQGDEIYIAEEFKIVSKAEEYNLICYKANITEETILANAKWQPASEMTEQQSRFKFKVGEVSVKRVHDISLRLMANLADVIYNGDKSIAIPNYLIYEEFSNWLKDQGIDYGANQYVALVELKETR